MKKADKWQTVVAALLATRTRQEAADLAGVAISTVYNYLKDPEFMELYEQEKTRLLNNITDRLQKSTTDAIDVLWDTVRDPDARQGDKISAAKILLETNLKYSEYTQLYNRLQRLENESEDD